MSHSIATSVASFSFENFPVRAINRNGEIWFVAADVCAVLDIKNPRDAVSTLDDDEKDVGITDTLGGKQKSTIINESGLYALILRSRKPEAKRFRKWVTSEVLPAIRKTGSYSLTITKAQQGELSTLIAERFPSGKDRPYAWSRFNNHFRLASYKDLPANRFGEACEYIKTMPEPVPALPKQENRNIDLFDPDYIVRTRQIALQYFDDFRKAVRDGTDTPTMDIPADVLAGLLAGSLWRYQFVLNISHEGKVQITPMPDPFDTVTKIISDPGWVNIAKIRQLFDACMTALTNRLGFGRAK
ncbi:hypothetical protein NAI64_05835 [Oxalobacter sp. OxGP1]|uniref:BRO family protein n=1 Tax=Oxalobacter paeniformigenes TaxID=2946594 RepID=UPI0022AE7B37|nr:BRO family protein [Oxalobacter paeniformigenes]MCZ4053246.1 hypothetical protein [Oxalobacter paeniformigenes]